MISPSVKCSLLDLVDVVGSVTDTDTEVVATVVYLVNSGKVRLCGSFAGATFILPPLPPESPPRPAATTVSLKALRQRNTARRRAAYACDAPSGSTLEASRALGE